MAVLVAGLWCALRSRLFLGYQRPPHHPAFAPAPLRSTTRFSSGISRRRPGLLAERPPALPQAIFGTLQLALFSLRHFTQLRRIRDRSFGERYAVVRSRAVRSGERCLAALGRVEIRARLRPGVALRAFFDLADDRAHRVVAIIGGNNRARNSLGRACRSWPPAPFSSSVSPALPSGGANTRSFLVMVPKRPPRAWCGALQCRHRYRRSHQEDATGRYSSSAKGRRPGSAETAAAAPTPHEPSQWSSPRSRGGKEAIAPVDAVTAVDAGQIRAYRLGCAARTRPPGGCVVVAYQTESDPRIISRDVRCFRNAPAVVNTLPQHGVRLGRRAVTFPQSAGPAGAKLPFGRSMPGTSRNYMSSR